MTTALLVGDVRERIKELADESVHCVVTSPPYFGLRDYGMAAQIGLEPTPDAYVAEMVSLFREVRRVLRSDGTFWLNLGDSYTGGGGGNYGNKIAPNHGQHATNLRNKPAWLASVGLAAKQRLMIPARVALALQADGWWLRDEIIWHKPNPMPVSVTDRTTPAHEMLYMFAKSSRYHYDMEAIKEPATHAGKIVSLGEKSFARGQADGAGVARSGNALVDTYLVKATRQPRSVWTIPPKPFSGAHFATFPPDLIRPCILAGCPPGGTVLDPFFGAGTTGLVAAELGRDCIGFELNPEYAAIARERLGLAAPPQPRIVIDLSRFRAELAAAAALPALQARLAVRRG